MVADCGHFIVATNKRNKKHPDVAEFSASYAILNPGIANIV